MATVNAGTKRKRGSEPKFYAVNNGRDPGVYYSWPDCQKQITGFKNAQCMYCTASYQQILTQTSQVFHVDARGGRLCQARSRV